MATITPTPTPVTPTPPPSPILPNTPTPTLLPSPTSTATPEARLLGVGTGFNPLWLIPMVIILGVGGYMALRSAHKKHPASADSEQTTTDESTTEGQEQVFLILTGQEPGGKHAFITRQEFNRSTHKEQN